MKGVGERVSLGPRQKQKIRSFSIQIYPNITDGEKYISKSNKSFHDTWRG